MRGTLAREIAERGAQRRSEALTGEPRGLLNFSAHRAANHSITSLGMLPALPTSTPLQTSDGRFKFRIGFSVVGGGDVAG